MQFSGPYRNVYTTRTDGVYFRCEYAGQTFDRGFAPDLDSARVRARSLCLSHRYKLRLERAKARKAVVLLKLRAG